MVASSWSGHSTHLRRVDQRQGMRSVVVSGWVSIGIADEPLPLRSYIFPIRFDGSLQDGMFFFANSFSPFRCPLMRRPPAASYAPSPARRVAHARRIRDVATSGGSLRCRIAVAVRDLEHVAAFAGHSSPLSRSMVAVFSAMLFWSLSAWSAEFVGRNIRLWYVSRSLIARASVSATE